MLALFLTLLHHGDLLACGCNRLILFADAQHVFKGKVLQMKSISEGGDKYGRQYYAKIKVTKVYKGKFDRSTVYVYVPCRRDACCGIDMKKGKYYLIYTYKGYDELRTNSCTETRIVEKHYEPDSSEYEIDNTR